MSYNPGGGGGSSQISTSTDVALNNPVTNDALTYNAGPAKWTNLPLFPLGSAENPQTNPTAARNSNLPVNWWAVPTGSTITNLGTSGFTDVVLYT